MDIRTYDADSDVDGEQMTHFDPYAELAAHMSLLQQAQDENERLRAELGQCVSENNQLTENAAELGKALDMCIAERDGAFAEVDAHRRELSALRDERPRLLAANARLADERDALRAELDAMRQAHSVIAARMAAMGC